MIKIMKAFSLVVVLVFGSGCATKTLQVSVPPASIQPNPEGYVKIVNIVDLRTFEKSPKDPSSPSIEGDFIENNDITDKAIGRMRHGLFHNALWNYTLKGDENIYSVCEKIATSSLTNAGYRVVTAQDAEYSKAVPLAVDILQFWAWMQPQFNIDLHFDGELRIKSTDATESIDVTGRGSEFFSTAMANGSAWTKLVDEGVKKLQMDLTLKLTEKTADSK